MYLLHDAVAHKNKLGLPRLCGKRGNLRLQWHELFGRTPRGVFVEEYLLRTECKLQDPGVVGHGLE